MNLTTKFFITFLVNFALLFQCVWLQFSNEIQYPKKKNIYSFYLEINEGISMAHWNKTRKTFIIAEKINGSFFLRDRRSSTACNAVFPMDPTLVNTMIKAHGLHKEILTINRMLPGTPIVVPVNAYVEITVKNSMKTNSLSIHWHGQNQYNTFYMDGVSRITQCPIGPGESFVYKFRATEFGTHWYHAHSGDQRMDGLYGPFIVTNKYDNGEIVDRSKEIPKTYDKEFYMLVQDWFQKSSESIINQIIWEDVKFFYGYDNMEMCLNTTLTDDGTPGIMFPFIRDTDAVLVNGKGSIHIMKQVNKIKDVDSILSSQAFKLDLEEFTVEPNKKYLFRVIGSNAGHPLEIRIGGHKLYVVASDGNPIKTIETDSLIVNGGERFDFYIKTKSSANMNYFIVVKTLETKDGNFKEIWADNFGLAILKYKNAKLSKITCSNACQKCNNKCVKVNCPFWPNENDGFYKCINVNKFQSTNIPKADHELLKNKYDDSNSFEEYFFNFHFSGSSSIRSSINGKRFVMPSIPQYFRTNTNSVLTVCNPTCFGGNQTCQCTHQVKIGLNKTIQFVLFNMGNGAGIEGNPHPAHLHGHHFYVVHVGYPTYFPGNYTYNKPNQDLNCNDDTEVCSKGAWRNESWKFGNIPNANLVDPPLKDTLFIPVGGYAVVRFKSDNIGYWFMHCHIDIHHAEGMAAIIQEGTSDEIANIVDFSKVNFCSSNLDRVKSFN